jgi:NTP pyrophosphatase (non-canonical NTP hydrolase)
MKFEQLQENIAIWAQEKGISAPENAPKQVLKVVEELGELCGSIAKDKRIEELDAFGDVLVTIIILAEQRQVDLVLALQEAYGVIKDRTGKTVNGVFVKDEG